MPVSTTNTTMTAVSQFFCQWMQPCGIYTDVQQPTTSTFAHDSPRDLVSNKTSDINIVVNEPHPTAPMMTTTTTTTTPKITANIVNKDSTMYRRSLTIQPLLSPPMTRPSLKCKVSLPYPTLIAPTNSLPPPPLTPPPTPGNLDRHISYSLLNMPLRPPPPPPPFASFSQILATEDGFASCPATPPSASSATWLLRPRSVSSAASLPDSNVLYTINNNNNTMNGNNDDNADNSHSYCHSSDSDDSSMDMLSSARASSFMMFPQTPRLTYSCGMAQFSHEKAAPSEFPRDLARIARQPAIEGSLTHAVLEVMLKYNYCA
ncbi:hypothetical protein BDF19DRAFT_446369 [Syncephalis fuscata]|nr:hypothetical protein BDF19DRAFT_446369 [Syncephalis fuscata]